MVLEAGSLRSWSGSGDRILSLCRLPASFVVSHSEEQRREASSWGSLLIRAIIPFLGASSSSPSIVNYLPDSVLLVLSD